MKQQSLAVTAEFQRYARPTRRGEFLSQMERVVPWEVLVALVEPHYPKGDSGRPPLGLERMLRIYFLQQWFDLSDPAVEDALYESPTMRRFVGVDLGSEPVPDETTVCKFRHLLKRNGLGNKMLTEVNGYLQRHGLKIGTGTIVDATLIQAPSSTKNRSGSCDPEMHPVKKGNPWYFGMKAHVGVDAGTKLIHSVAATVANVADSRMLPELLHGEETEVGGIRPTRATPRPSPARAKSRRHSTPTVSFPPSALPAVARPECAPRCERTSHANSTQNAH